MSLHYESDGACWDDGMRACRLCNSELVKIAPMSALPPTDKFTREPTEHALTPADLYLCNSCGHVQLTDVIPAAKLFEDYLFHTGDNPALVEHFRNYAEECKRRFSPSFVVEIGSNDGTLLTFFEGASVRVLGVDPNNVRKKVQTISAYFTHDLALQLKKEYQQPDLICANHVFAHADDLSSMVKGVKELLSPDGVFVFEAAYLHDLLDHKYYDTVFHEHLSYHSVDPLIPFFERHGLELFGVTHNDCKGGSIRGFVQHEGGRRNQKWYVMNAEDISIAQVASKFAAFNSGLSSIRKKVSGIEKAIGYGASASGIAMMYHAGLTDRISFLVDDDPRKIGLYSPAKQIVRNPADLDLYKDLPIVILAPRYTDAIRARHPEHTNRFVELR